MTAERRQIPCEKDSVSQYGRERRDEREEAYPANADGDPERVVRIGEKSDDAE